MGSEDKFHWTSDSELRLLQCLYGHKPIGVSQSFLIIIVWEKFKKIMGQDIPLSVVKDKLSTFYNFDAAEIAHGGQFLQFPQEDFYLPRSEFPECYADEDEESSDGKK